MTPNPAFKWINQGANTKHLVSKLDSTFSRDYDYSSYSLHSTKVDILELEKTLASRSHHSDKPGFTRNNMVQPIMLDNIQGKYTLNLATSMKLHLFW